MEFFTKTKAIKLRSHLYKYLIADFDQETVRQTRHGISRKAVIWFVELVDGKSHVIRLRNCYGKYLAASDLPFFLGVTGKKILQTVPEDITDICKMEWEPVRDGSQVKFKSWCGNFLRANGGAPPWRNAVTHDEPPTGSTQKWIFWDIEAVQVPENDSLVDYLSSMSSFSTVPDDVLVAISGDYKSPERASQLSIVPAARIPRLTSAKSMFPRLFSSPNNKSSDSNASSPRKSDGRTIYYHVADESGEVDDDATERCSLNFKGNGVDGLTQKLKEDTGLEDIVVCTRSPLNGELYPLRLQLPPNNADMHVILVQPSSKVASDFAEQGTPL